MRDGAGRSKRGAVTPHPRLRNGAGGACDPSPTRGEEQGGACDRFLRVCSSPILLQNSDLAIALDFACPVSGIAHLGHEGIARRTGKLAQEARRAFLPASDGLGPLQIQIDENRAPSRSRVLQQHPPKAALKSGRQKCASLRQITEVSLSDRHAQQTCDFRKRSSQPFGVGFVTVDQPVTTRTAVMRERQSDRYVTVAIPFEA